MRLSFPPCIGYRWLYHKTLQNLTAEDSSTHEVAASVSQGSGYGLLGASAPSFTAPHSLTALAGWLSSPSSAGEELLPSSHRHWDSAAHGPLVRGPQLPPGCWPEATLRSLPRGSLYTAAHNTVAGFIGGGGVGANPSSLQQETHDLLSMIGSPNSVSYKLYPTCQWIRSQIQQQKCF